jgi:hypothetical protein
MYAYWDIDTCEQTVVHSVTNGTLTGLPEMPVGADKLMCKHGSHVSTIILGQGRCAGMKRNPHVPTYIDMIQQIVHGSVRLDQSVHSYIWYLICSRLSTGW